MTNHAESDEQDVVDWFKTLGTPRDIEPSPNFVRKVMIEIDAYETRPRWWEGLQFTQRHILTPVLTFCLLISLAYNVYQSTKSVPSLNTPKRLFACQDVYDSTVFFDSYLFQSCIKSPVSLGKLATTYIAIEEPSRLGFASQSEVVKFYYIGAWYAEALAYLHGDDRDGLAQSLTALEKALHALPDSRPLAHYVDKLHALLASEQNAMEVLKQELPRVQSWLETYARSRGTEQLTRFRMGAWLVDLRLAAAAGDKAALRQREKTLFFKQELIELHLHTEIPPAFEKMVTIMAKPEITDGDIEELQQQVMKLHAILG